MATLTDPNQADDKKSYFKQKYKMAGHNKWTQIKRKKEVVDAKKSKQFSLLAKTIQLEAKKSSGDRNAVGLKTAIERARAANMPNSNIERAIEAATSDQTTLEAVTYEGYGPGGVALLITGLTASRNRTAQEIKHLLAEHGGALAAPGAVTWAFEKTATGWQPKIERVLTTALRETITKLINELENHADVHGVFTDIKTA
ncbi:MAG: YebC/PmpR family DNA-binding transcriptional regulator [Patescibacteria group bacterium]